MTRNQILYQQNVETKRHNLGDEGIRRDTLAETTRHNLRTEDQTDTQLSETIRHNKASESGVLYTADRRKEGNIGAAQIHAQTAANQLAETIRSNVARENLMTRSYDIQEAWNSMQADLKREGYENDYEIAQLDRAVREAYNLASVDLQKERLQQELQIAHDDRMVRILQTLISGITGSVGAAASIAGAMGG